MNHCADRGTLNANFIAVVLPLSIFTDSTRPRDAVRAFEPDPVQAAPASTLTTTRPT